MNKKVISLVLALVMVLGTFTSVFAAGEAKDAPKKEEAKKEETKKEAPKDGEKVEKIVGKDNKIQYIVDKKFVEGYADGSMGYDKNITRAEITRLLVLANGNEELAKQLQGSMKIYSDVDVKHWANGVISVGTTRPSDANKIAMLAGYPDKSFKPDKNVSYAELAKMLVVLVKKDLTEDMVKNAKWATSWLNWAAELGILEDVTIADSNAPATRADAFTMMYNALYKMVEFRRVPANAKVGVLSSLRDGKLILNQDPDKQTYTITKDTVFIRTWKEEIKHSNIIYVKKITNPDYLLGSLVRVMVNDKNEVTHILELGNPKDMALEAASNVVTKNSRWADVAKYTVETGVTDINTLKDKDDSVKFYEKGYVNFDLKGDRSSANAIRFYSDKAHNYALVKSLSINSDTKVYVANPFNNQMREVKDINEALNLIGFRNYEAGYAVPNVYAGFDTDGYEASLYGYKNDIAPAKVIVFNVVTKAKGGETLRVVLTEDTRGNATLQDTDGVKKDRSFINSIANFPHNSADGLYDVIKLSWKSFNNNYDYVEKLIDHDDISKYPVVKVKEVQDNNNLTVTDRFGEETTIYVGDADIFTKPEYKNMRDKYVQFRNVNGNEELAKLSAGKQAEDKNIEILSILPNDRNVVEKFEKSSSMKYIVKCIQKGTANGTIIEEPSKLGDKYIAKIDVQADNWKKDVYHGILPFVVSDKDAALLKANVNRSIKFIIDEKDRWREYPTAFQFESNDGKELKPGVSDRIKAYTDAVDAYKAKAPAEDKDITEANVKELQELLDKVKEAQGNLTKADKENIPSKYLEDDKLKLNTENVQKKLNSVEEVRAAREDLTKKIKEAKELLNKVEQSEETDASKIEKGKEVASTANKNAFNTAITTAETDGPTKTTKADIDVVRTTLEGAITTFTGQIVKGTKEASK